jgi:tetratricopeptide (TPR) repeat protein
MIAMNIKNSIFRLLFVSFFISSGILVANDLNVVNPLVAHNDTLYLNYYDNNHIFFPGDSIYAYIYSYTNEKGIPDGYNCYLQRLNAGDTLIGKFVIPDNSLYGLIKIGDRFTFDTHKGDFWEYCVIDADSVALRNAHYRVALTYLGTNPDNYRRTPDFQMTLENYQTENMYYPDNLVSVIAEISLNYELGKISHKDYEEQMERIIASSRFDWNNEDEIEVIIKSLRILGKTEKANSLELKYAKHYPNSRLTKEKEFEELAKIDDFNEFIDKSLLFIKKFNNSEYNEKLYLAIIQSYLQTGQFDKILNLFENMEVPSDIYYQIAFNLVENKNLKVKIKELDRYNTAKKLLVKATERVQKEIYPNLVLTPVEVTKLKDLKFINFLFLLAKLHWKEEKLDSLENIFSRILLFDKRLYNPEQLYRMSLYAYEFGRYEIALKLSKMYLSLDIKDIKIRNINKNSFIKFNPIEKYKEYYDSLNIIYQRHKLSLISSDMLDKNIELPTVKTLDGVTTSLKMFQGRILVIYSFGYFCDQCWDLFTDIDKLFDDYTDNNDVMIFPVLLWEKDKKKLLELQKFIDKNKLHSSIYYDYLNDVYRNLSITGVPTVTIIGQEGRENFRIEGIKPNKSMYEQIKRYIKYLSGGEWEKEKK